MFRKKVNRRTALAAGVASAGAFVGSHTPKAQVLQSVWGADFLTQWSPPEYLKRDLTPGNTPIRLSCTAYRISYEKNTPIEDRVKNIRDMGYTACEAGEEWTQATDSEIVELKEVLKKYDVQFYTIHVFRNNIHPDLTIRKENHRKTIAAIEAAERIGLKFIVSHIGSCSPERANFPHRDNWTKETWTPFPSR